jgi:hypothetical protein
LFFKKLPVPVFSFFPVYGQQFEPGPQTLPDN